MNKSRITAASLLLSSALVTGNANANDTIKNNSEGNIAPTAVNMLKDAVASNVSDKLNLNNVDILIRGTSYGLGYENQNIYGEVTSDFNNETGAGLAYKSDLGLVLGGNYSEKKDVGTQTGLGVGYIKSFDNSYLGASAKYTNFDANTKYADSDSIKAQLLGGYEVAPGLFAEAGVAYKTFQAKDYDRENTLEGSLGLSYVQPDYALRVSGTVNEYTSRVMASISFPIGGKNKVSSFNVGQSTLARSLANSSFDNTIVKVKKVPVVAPVAPTTPNTLPTGANVNSDALYSNTFSVNLSSNLSDTDGDSVTAVFVGSGVSSGDIVISGASISGNVATITVSNGTGSGYIDYQVTDGKVTNPTTYRIIIAHLDGV